MKVNRLIRFALRYWYLSVVVLLSLISYMSVLVSPAVFWPVVFLSYAIPGFLMLNGLLMFMMAIGWRHLIVFPAIGLVCGFPFFLVSVKLNTNRETAKNAFSVLSLNAKFFRKPKTYDAFSLDMIKWVAKDSSDIKCIQEYSTDNRWEPLDATKQITMPGYHAFTLQSKVEDRDHNPGLAIFTKFDILDSGVVWEDTTTSNGTIFVDLLVRKDTLRVYNVHLGSMGLNVGQYKNPHYYGYKLKTLVAKLRHGATNRSAQIDRIIEHSKTSPYPYLIGGDFNETPYSYNYLRLRRHFSNAFEKKGKDFAFS